MKIYNEVVIDMNPESSSYGETLHEDSYEYQGDMMLCGERFAWNTGMSFTDAKGDVWTSDYWLNAFNETTEIKIYKNGNLDNQYDTDGSLKNAEANANVQAYIDKQQGDFTWTKGEFDPTSEEFRQSVEETGGFGEISKGYGQDPMDFEKFYGAPLDYAKEQYGTGKQALSLQTGKSLGDIYSQTEQAQVASGFESSGAIDYTKTKAATGVMGDYLTQQQELSNQLAFKTADFWKTTEDQFYAELEENIAAE